MLARIYAKARNPPVTSAPTDKEPWIQDLYSCSPISIVERFPSKVIRWLAKYSKRLSQVSENNVYLTDQQIICTIILLLNAGHEATVNTLGNGLNALITNNIELIAARLAM